MTEEVDSLLEEYREIAREAQTLTFLPRDIELQKQAVEDLNEFINKLNSCQIVAIENGEEENANLILAMRCCCKAVRSELKMWIGTKNGSWVDAWDHLIDAQEFLKSAQAAHEFTRTGDIDRLRSKYDWIEKFVFPPQMYLSPGLVVDKYLCSICGGDYQNCEHLAGLPYWGQICSRIIEDAKTREVSVVDQPEDKKCRITHFSTDDGKVRDRMTWTKFTPDDDSRLSSLTEGGNQFTGIVMRPSGVYSEEEIQQLRDTRSSLRKDGLNR